MSKAVFRLSDAFSAGWNGFKNNALILIVLLLFTFIASSLVNAIFGGLPIAVTIVLSMLVSTYFTLSLMKAAISAAKGETVGWDVLKNDFSLYMRFFAVSLIFSIMIFIGMFMLFIPMFFVCALFFSTLYIITDKKDISIFDAFAKSFKLSVSQIWLLLLFVIISIVLAIIGLIALIVGILIAAPVIYVTAAYIYGKLDAGIPVEPTTAETAPPTVNIIK